MEYVQSRVHGRKGLIRRVRAVISLPLSQCIPLTLPSERKLQRVGDDRLFYDTIGEE